MYARVWERCNVDNISISPDGKPDNNCGIQSKE